MANEIKISLKNLGFKDNEIKVYLALTALGEASAATIAKKADMPRTTVISILEKLEENRYLTIHKYRGTAYYWIESPQALVGIFENKIEIAKMLGVLLTEDYRREAHFPFANTYDTKTTIRQFMEKFLITLDKGETIYTIDTPKAGNYSKISASENVGNAILGIKRKRQIKTRTLIPYGTYDNDVIRKTEIQNIELREMPKGIEFNASLWLAKNTLVHFSGNPPFITAITHEKIVAGIKSVFDYLWSIAKTVN